MIELPNKTILTNIEDIISISPIYKDTFTIKYQNDLVIVRYSKSVKVLEQCYNIIMTELKKIKGDIIKLDYIEL